MRPHSSILSNSAAADSIMLGIVFSRQCQHAASAFALPRQRWRRRELMSSILVISVPSGMRRQQWAVLYELLRQRPSCKLVCAPFPCRSSAAHYLQVQYCSNPCRVPCRGQSRCRPAILFTLAVQQRFFRIM